MNFADFDGSAARGNPQVGHNIGTNLYNISICTGTPTTSDYRGNVKPRYYILTLNVLKLITREPVAFDVYVQILMLLFEF